MALPSVSFSHTILLVTCFIFVFAFGIKNAKNEPATVSDIYSVRRLYETRHHPLFSVDETIRAIVSVNTRNHTPLYPALLNLWARAAGRDLFSLRLFSIFLGLLTIASTYRLARFSGKAEALDTALFLSFLAFFLYYTQIARVYALLVLLAPWVLFSYWQALRAAAKHFRIAWLSLAIGSSALLYTHLFGIFVLATIGIYHIAFAPRNRRWITVCLALIVAGIVFLPWLPIALEGMLMWNESESGSLPILDAVAAAFSAYSNGLTPLIPITGLVIARHYRRLGAPQRYIVFVACLLLIMLLAANEFTTVIVARRMRYTLILASVWSVAIAIGLNLLPRWSLLRIPALICWLAAFFAFWGSDDMRLYNNSLDLRHDDVPNYQYLNYEPSISPLSSDFVLSLHQDSPYRSKHRLHFYGNMTGSWRGVIQFWNSTPDDAGILSSDPRYNDLESMTHWNFPIWSIHDPRRTDPLAMPAYQSYFVPQFHSCGRYLDTADTVVDLVVKRSIKCALLTSEQPFQLRFDNGAELENILIEQEDNALNVYFWWTRTIANKYAFSIQLFDDQDLKAAQLDDVVGGDSLRGYSLDLSALAPGDYTVKLILYDFETGSVQAGTIIADERSFERAVDVGRITISA